MAQKYNPLLKFNFQRDGTDALNLQSKTLNVSPLGNDTTGNGSISSPYKTIEKAVTVANSIATLTDSICVFVNSGEYIELPMTLANNVYIVGESQDTVIIKPVNPASVLFTLGDVTGLSFITILDVVSNSAVEIDNAQENVLIHKVYFINCYTSIRMLATSAECYPYLEYVSVDNPIFSAFEVITTANYCEVSAENTYVYSISSQSSDAEVVCDGANSMFIYHTGSVVNQFSVGAGNGFLSRNGGSYKLRNLQIEGYEYGIIVENSGVPDVEISACTFSVNVYNFYVNNASATGYFTGYSDYERYYIHPTSSFFITDKDAQVITVAKKGGNFDSVKDAIDSITDNNVTRVYTIKVGSGVFIEDTIQMKPYVNVVGESINSTIIEVDSPSKDLILAVGNSGLFRLQLRGSTAVNKSAIIFNGGVGVFRCNEVRFGSNYCFYKQNSTDGNATSIFNGCSAETSSNFTQAFDITCNGATPSTFAFNTFVYTGTGINFIKAYGLATQISAANFTVAKIIQSGYGIHAYNGATVSINAVTLVGFDKAVYNENLGAGILIYTGAFALRGNVTDIQLDNISTTGSIFGFFSKSKIIIDPNIDISLLFTDITGEGTISLGEFWLGNKYSEVYNVKGLIEAQTLGLVEGGELYDGGGFVVDIEGGYGYLEDVSGPTDVYKRFDWSGSSITLSSNQDVYIYINSNGNIVSNSSRPSTTANILLGRVVTNAIGIKYIEQAKFDAHHTGNKLSTALRNVFGPIFADGAGIVTSNTSREVSVLPGEYYFGEIEISLVGKAFADDFIPIYRGATPGTWNELTPTNIIDNSLYDDGSGTLAAVPGGTPFVKHTLYVTNNGTGDTYYLVIGQDVFGLVDGAINSPYSLVPSWFREQTVILATIVTDSTTGTTATVTDMRPRPSFVVGAGTSVTAHSALSGLGDDDHPQYILTDGSRAFTGNIDAGGNNVTNVNLVDGVDVSSHMSRHLPNGIDALTTAAPIANLGGSSTNSVGIANSYSRSDHSHAINIASSGVTGLLTSSDWNYFDAKLNAADFPAQFAFEIAGKTTADLADTTNFRYVTDAEKTVLSNTSGINTGDQTITLTSDVTGSGTGSFPVTIANDAVTFAKMQNINTATLIGRSTVGTGDPESITIGSGLSLAGGVLTNTGAGLTVNSAVAAGDITTTSATDVVATTMTITPGAGTYVVLFSSDISHNTNGGIIQVSIYANGVLAPNSTRTYTRGNQVQRCSVYTQAVVTVAAGQAIDVRWNRGGSGTATMGNRSLFLIKQ